MKFGKSSTQTNSSKISKLALYILLVFVAFCAADLTIIYLRDLMIPNQAPPKKVTRFTPPAVVDRSQFSVIVNRNLFSSSGVMPEAITSRKDDQKKENDPIPSQLPIGVIGTLVHSDPERSIAALSLKTKNKTGSYSVGADVDGLATIEKIERNIVFIRNSNSGMLEYIEMAKPNSKVAFGTPENTAPKTPGKKEVISTGNNTFVINRADLLKYTNDLAAVLMQARAVPNRDPVTGAINGYRVLDMQPGSIYEQLGLQRMDVIKGVNGEAVDSVQKAMEMYNTLKNGNQVKIQIERGGKTDTFTYDIK